MNTARLTNNKPQNPKMFLYPLANVINKPKGV